MKQFFQQYSIQILGGACAVAGVACVSALFVSGAPDAEERAPMKIEVLDQELLSDEPPSMSAVLAKHLFVPDREATGQNSFPDLVVKGVYLGTERNALFSLKSKPQANLRIWEESVDDALDQVVDSKDPRQPIVQFLREWSVERIEADGVTVKHFITGEVETYAVDYTPTKKVKDDALRGYGQGTMPQGGGGTGKVVASTQQRGNPGARRAGGSRSSAPGSPEFMADRVSSMLKNMSPQLRQRFLQRAQQNTGGGGNSGNNTQQSSGKASSNKSSKKSKKK